MQPNAYVSGSIYPSCSTVNAKQRYWTRSYAVLKINIAVILHLFLGNGAQWNLEGDERSVAGDLQQFAL
jgi:hypothetical protein